MNGARPGEVYGNILCRHTPSARYVLGVALASIEAAYLLIRVTADPARNAQLVSVKLHCISVAEICSWFAGGL
jgi:hypothetical protein